MSPKNEKTVDCIFGCTLCTFGTAFLAGSVSYLVFGIMYLIEDYDIWKEQDNGLWPYVLVSIILSFNKKNSVKSKDANDSFPIGELFCTFIIEFSLMIWGAVELFNNTPKNSKLYNSNLWKFGLATFIIQLTVAIIIIAIPVICMCLPKKKEPEYAKSTVFEKDGKFMVSIPISGEQATKSITTEQIQKTDDFGDQQV